MDGLCTITAVSPLMSAADAESDFVKMKTNGKMRRRRENGEQRGPRGALACVALQSTFT
jgi:hypothetical protein